MQGYNVPFAALLTMGESWHNNHHAFPGSARLGLRAGEWDPGWWVLLGFIPLVGVLVLLFFLVKDSEAGSNAYGPNPKGLPAVV